jgi:hypothetical protein
MVSRIIMGEDPIKVWDEQTLKQRSVAPERVLLYSLTQSSSTLDKAYSEIVASTANAAQDHLNIADALNSQVVEVLRILERRSEEMKKKVCSRHDATISVSFFFDRKCNSFTNS